MGPQHGSKLEGRLNGLDADMQQPTACRKDEGDRVRRVAPKLIANGESHALESEARAQLEASGLGCHVAVKRAGMEGREAYWSAAARDCGKARGKNHSRERDKGTRMCAPGVPAGHNGGKATERTRWMPMDSVCEGGAVCECSDRTDAR